MRSGIGLLVALVALTACATPPPPPPPPPPIRFAVIGAPEIGSDPAALEALQAAMTRITVTRGLTFVLVPGPLLAPGSSKDTLEDLKGTLDFSTVPLYVSFAPAPPGPAREGSITGEDVLAALENRGPGAARKVAFRAEPSTNADASVVALGPDGKPPPEPAPPKVKVSVAFSALGVEPHHDVIADVVVRASAGDFELAPGKAPDGVVVRVPPVAKAKAFAIVTCDGGEAKLEVFPLDTKAPPTKTLGPVRLAVREGRLLPPPKGE
jgi:hypothetical protein